MTGVNVPLSQILLVSNATTGSVLYSMAGPAAASYTQATDSVITLASAPGATDKLTIYYDDASGAATETGNLAIIKDEAILIDAKLPALSAGRIPVESANTDSEEFTFSQTGAIAVGTTLISIDAQKFREVVVFVTSIGTSGAIGGQISFNGTTWNTIQPVLLNSNSGSLANVATLNAPSIYNTYGARYFRLAMTVGATAGTTTVTAWASQTVTPKNYSSVAVSGTVTVSSGTITPSVSANNGFGSYHTLISAASTNATSVKASGGTIGTLTVTNSTASLRWFRLFNLIVAPTVGTSTPVLNFQIPPNSMEHIDTSFAGLRLPNGIAYAITGGTATAAVTDSTAVGAGDVVVNMSFI